MLNQHTSLADVAVAVHWNPGLHILIGRGHHCE